MLSEDKKAYHVQLFSGVEHGFALRGDQNDPYQRKLGQDRFVSKTLSSLLL